VIIPFQFTEALAFSEGLTAAELNGKLGFIDKTGKVVRVNASGDCERYQFSN
jgi:hypothetical protein